MRSTTGWQSLDPTGNTLTRVTFERRDLRPDDIAVRIDYCGVCHSDLHRIHGMLGEKDLVPGHEATGVVVATGPAVTGFAVGERVAIGTIVDSCGECAMCLAGQENYCYHRPTTTYGGTDRIDGTPTMGAYSREYVLREKFAFHLPDGLDPAAAAPLMCAGVSVWEPLRAAGAGPGSRVAVAGLGGLGHLAVKLAAALGAEVTVLSRTAAKEQDALSLGAAELLVTTDEAQVAAARAASTSSSTPSRPTTSSRRSSACSASTGPCASSETPCWPARGSGSSEPAARSSPPPAREGCGRPWRCWSSAPSTASRRTSRSCPPARSKPP
ncbi:Alcohol dehydrogenase [[Actinomadura] parvosata subsp. kistnae]|uniref:NAD(P)-dependent alcohol dehydrogenase n=1 Tax=[Actinomadura] parvosata TaxID=1955412 RepID=UPI000D282125|nr:Alcohol dehydrogenase [Actinomadura parvosata subsp. kistnae]